MILLLAATAHAQTDEHDAPSLDAARSADTGALLPSTTPARGDGQRALAHVRGGYDAAYDSAVLETILEAQVIGPLSLRAGGSYHAQSGILQPDVALRVDALRQERHGIDLALGTGYEALGFNLTPAVVARVALGRALGATTLVANLGYGQGLEADERYGDARFAAMLRVATDLQLGLDSRFRVDLERDDDEPADEPDWELAAGPIATWSYERWFVTAAGGVSSFALRLDPRVRIGPSASLGVGTVF